MSGSLCWQIVRNNHAYMVKRRDINKPFSSEPMNLKNVHSFRYNGFCRNRQLGIDPSTDGKGIVLSYRTRKYKNQPGKNIKKSTITSGPRMTLHKIHRFIKYNRYRTDLRMAALRRASAILRSQKAKPFKKIHWHKKTSKTDKKPETGERKQKRLEKKRKRAEKQQQLTEEKSGDKQSAKKKTTKKKQVVKKKPAKKQPAKPKASKKTE